MSKNKKYSPFVSVCTPTFNRRPFIPIMFECFKNQTYPKDRLEWIIVDDGTDCINDLISAANIPQIKYFRVEKKMTLGEKRNYMHKQSKGSIIVYMDDDDYYPPERVSHAVERLLDNPHALCAGSSEMYIYFKHIQQMYQCGPYGPNHATAATFAFRVELLKETQYENHASLAEEKAFLKNYTVPFVQLDSLKTILVFSHEHNSFDKRELLKNPHPDVFKPSNKTVDMFIKNAKEEKIKNFFLKDIDSLLSKYEPGLPKMKPDVLKQIKEIDAQRSKMMEEQNRNAPIMLQQPGKEPVALSSQEVIGIIEQQQRQLQEMGEHIQRLEMNKTSAWPPQSPFTQPMPPQSPFTQNQMPPQSPFVQSPFTQNQMPPKSPFTQNQPPQSPFTQPMPPQSPFTQNQPPQSPFTQPIPPQGPFTQPIPPQNQFVIPNQPSQNKEADIEMAEQRIAELEKQNIELNTKFSQTFNELQKYKRLSETQKITINNLQTEKADLLLNQKKHVTFMNEK
jgi:glycosyltransferase involved in cell wall biosynthesis